jgi:hypothetical protein
MCGNGRCETLSILRKTPAEREREREKGEMQLNMHIVPQLNL